MEQTSVDYHQVCIGLIPINGGRTEIISPASPKRTIIVIIVSPGTSIHG